MTIKESVMAKQKRARDDKGQFVADNPDTPENEAWVSVGGVEASGTTDQEPEKPKLMGWKGYTVIFFALLVLSLLGVTS
tara:strand:+ start:163 stop:399 length:237 start_codon:yes stop_codon:yes gene_type:complete